MGGVFSAISSFGVRSLPSYFYDRFLFSQSLRAPLVHSVLAAQELLSDGQKEGQWPEGWLEPVGCVTHVESLCYEAEHALAGLPGH